jgi:peptidyl-prolyl cis-trans isomerase A (cyclophilin A)
MLKRLFALVLLTVAMPVFAQTPTPAPAPATVRVALETNLGTIVVELETGRAPITAGNFLRYVDARRYDGATFYRAMTIAPRQGLIQAGIRDARRLFPPIAHEPTSRTGLRHEAGSLSAPRFEPGSARSDFTIMLQPVPAYDANPEAPGDNLGYAVFGRVVEGMDVVHRIHEAPTSATEGEGVMRGQMLSPQVRIISARRVPATAAPAPAR